MQNLINIYSKVLTTSQYGTKGANWYANGKESYAKIVAKYIELGYYLIKYIVCVLIKSRILFTFVNRIKYNKIK